MNDIQRNRALDIIANHVGVSLDALAQAARLDEDLGCDSLDVVELLMAMEDEFMMSFSPEEDVQVLTVGILLNLVELHLGAAA